MSNGAPPSVGSGDHASGTAFEQAAAASGAEMAAECAAPRQDIVRLGDKMSAAIARQTWRIAAIVAGFAAVLTLGQALFR